MNSNKNIYPEFIDMNIINRYYCIEIVRINRIEFDLLYKIYEDLYLVLIDAI